MPDEFNLEGDGLEPEASLDDFFQPSAEPGKPEPSKPGKAAPPSKGAKPPASDARLPVDKDKPLPEEAPLPSLEVTDAGAEEPAKEKLAGGLLSNKFLLIGIGVLAVAVLGVGSYFVYTTFISSGEEEVAVNAPPAPPKTTTPAGEAASTEPPAPAAKIETPPLPDKKAKPGAKGQETTKPDKKAEAKKAAEPPVPAPGKTASASGKPAPAAKGKETKPAVAAGKEPAGKASENKKAPALPPAKPPQAPAPKVAMSSTGPYTIQVGSYALEESKATPEKMLKELGLNAYHYVDQNQRVGLFDVVAGKGLDKSQADALAKSLGGLNFVPRLEPEGNGYRVIAYSYGKRSDADRAKAKIERAGLGKVSISSSNKTMTLHQLRVGGFSSRAAAQETMTALRKAGFHPVIVREQ